MKIIVQFTPNPPAYGTHGPLADAAGVAQFVVPTNDTRKAVEWIKAHPHYVPAGRTARFFTEDGVEIKCS